MKKMRRKLGDDGRMPMIEARCRSLESRGACALSDRCSETRHRDRLAHQNTCTCTCAFPRRARATRIITSAISTHHHHHPPVFLHSCTSSLCRPLRKYPNTIVILFFISHSTRGQPGSKQQQRTSIIIAASQPALPHRHPPSIHTELQSSSSPIQGRTF